MFRTDAFGRLIRCAPRLMFNEAETPMGSSSETIEPEPTGFPADTAIAEMTAEQEAAYWKHQSRKHESKARSRADYDDIKAKADRLDELEAENVTEQERAVNAARDAGFADGQTDGAKRYLKSAVTARFQLLTGKSDEDVATAFAHVDVKSFVGDAGEIDTTALTEFANTFGAKQNEKQPPRDPIAEALQRQRGGSSSNGGDGSGSISAIREAAREKLSPSQK